MRAVLLALLVGCTATPPGGARGSAPGGPTTSTLPDSGQPTWTAPFRIGTFNIDWLSPRVGDPTDFEPRNEVDHAHIRSLIETYDLSLLALQEIEGRGALEVLGFDDRWRYTVGASGWSQNLALLYRADRFEVGDVREVHLPGTDFPSKDPLVATVSNADLVFTVVVVHASPYADAADAAYRRHQAEELRLWLDANHAPHDRVLVLGDFNDEFGGIHPGWPSLEVLEDPPDWRFATRQADGTSNIPYNSLIDHILLSDGLVPHWTEEPDAHGCHVIAHDRTEPWANYAGGWLGRQNVSSHRPVWIELSPTAP